MPLLPSPNDQNFKPCPAGNHVAVCFRIVDLGSQRDAFNEGKMKHQIMISWEIPDEMMENGKPFVISAYYTWSMSKKAKLRAMLESWRGRPLEERDFQEGGFEIKHILGVGCMLNVVHTKREDGSDRAIVSSVARLPKGIVAPKLSQPEVYVWLSKDEYSYAAFDTLRDELKEKLKTTPEWKIATGLEVPAHEIPVAPVDEAFIDDEVPF